MVTTNLEITEDKAARMNKLEDTLRRSIDILTARCILNAIKGNRQTDTARQALHALVSCLHDSSDR